MKKANTLGPFFVNKDSNLNDLILDTLSKNSNLTAKQIYYFIKNRFGTAVSYQAIHKAITDLVKKDILKKEDRFYSISSIWLDFIESFVEKSREIRKNDFMKKLDIKKSNNRIKIISFDLDGCLSDNTFDDIFWDREIPKLVAHKKNISLEEAYKYVVDEYKRLWGKVDDWRNPNFWLKHFGLKETWEEIMEDLKKEIKHYGDSIPVLKKLREDYTLIITSHADRIFLDLKLKMEDLGSYFDYTFSTPSDFNNMKKDAEVYKKICKMLGVRPNEIIHIGDHYEFDYVVPMSVGIRSFLIDRSGKLKEDYVVRSLYDFATKIE